MKAACRYTPSVVHRSVHRFLQTFVLILLVGLLAACPAPPPPAAPPAAEPAAPEATQTPEPPEAAPEDNPLACSNPAEPDKAIPYIALFQASSEESEDYFEFTAAPDMADGTRASQTVRVRVSSESDLRLMPVELCPMTSGDNCNGQSDLTGEQAEAIQALAPDAIELVRFEIVDLELTGALDPNGEVAGGSIKVDFTPSVELWAEFNEGVLEDVGSALAQDAPRTGYWSCQEGSFAWTELTTEKHSLRVVIERSDGVNLLIYPTAEAEMAAVNVTQGIVPVPGAMDVAEAAGIVKDVLLQVNPSATGGKTIYVQIGDSATFSIADFLAALREVEVLAMEGELSYKTFAVANVANWNDPALGMYP